MSRASRLFCRAKESFARGGLTGTATPIQAKEAPGAGMWHEDMDGHTSDRAENSPALRAPIPTGVYRERRHGLVLWIANKANRFSLKNLTIHYASNYLDRWVPPPPHRAMTPRHVSAAAVPCPLARSLSARAKKPSSSRAPAHPLTATRCDAGTCRPCRCRLKSTTR